MARGWGRKRFKYGEKPPLTPTNQRILDVFNANKGKPLTRADIVRITGFGRSSVNRAIQELREAGYDVPVVRKKRKRN